MARLTVVPTSIDDVMRPQRPARKAGPVERALVIGALVAISWAVVYVVARILWAL
jgi:hypothetical protein